MTSSGILTFHERVGGGKPYSKEEVALTREATEAEWRHLDSPTHQGVATFKTRLPSPFFVTVAGTVLDRPPRVTVTR